MGQTVVKFGPDQFVIWSNVVDAPVSWIMSKEKVVDEWWGRVWGLNPTFDKEHLRLVVDKIDQEPQQLRDILAYNRAGKNESQLNLEELIDQYSIHTLKELKCGHLSTCLQVPNGWNNTRFCAWCNEAVVII